MLPESIILSLRSSEQGRDTLKAVKTNQAGGPLATTRGRQGWERVHGDPGLRNSRRQEAVVQSVFWRLLPGSKPGSARPKYVNKHRLGNHMELSLLIWKIKIVIIVPTSQDVRR